MDDREAGYLWDIIQAGEEIAQFISGKRPSDFESDRMLRLAVERDLEIIGEAARRLSPTFREAHPDVPWSSVISLRNVLAHDYGEVKLERIWIIVKERVPELIAELKSELPPSA